MSRTLLGKYKNGNYYVCIYSDGSKIRFNNHDTFSPEFPESIDMKISNRCDMGCPFCHEQSVYDGALANLNHPLLDSLHPYTELALGGGNVLEHPDLNNFLKKMKEKNIICNITLHLKHFITHYDLIKHYCDENLIHGIGISVNENILPSELQMIQSIPNAVVHCILGIVPFHTLTQMKNKNIKLLFLGYKDFGRGHTYIEVNDDIQQNIKLKIDYIHDHLSTLQKWFSIISFDNLAIRQLNLRDMFNDNIWEQRYMGNDGQYTMYVDLVKEEYAISSISPRRPIGNEADIKNLFHNI